MTLSFRRSCACFFIILFCLSPSVHADRTAEAGRFVLEKYQDAVIKVKLVIRFKLLMNGSEMKNNESKIEATGTVLHPSGLTLISLNKTDPGRLADNNLRKNNTAGRKMELESELTDVLLILPDGKEIPAKVVLRDRDLDLAFVEPLESPAKPLAAIDLDDIGSADVLDEIFSVGRLDKIATRVPAVLSDRIVAVMQKPRTFYIPLQSRDMGTPVFTENGSWLGVVLLRSVTAGNINPNAMVVILPAADIIEVARQVPGMEAIDKKPGVESDKNFLWW